jgi:hypothetical protein
MYINIMVPENTEIFGLDKEDDKIKGLAEFSFNDREGLTLPSMLVDVIPKKKQEPVIIERNGRRNKRKSGDELF